jgi:hypothetical protein
LVGKVVDQFAVFAVFAGKDFFELEDRTARVNAMPWYMGSISLRINGDRAVTLEDLGNGGEDSVPNDHVFALP